VWKRLFQVGPAAVAVGGWPDVAAWQTITRLATVTTRLPDGESLYSKRKRFITNQELETQLFRVLQTFSWVGVKGLEMGFALKGEWDEDSLGQFRGVGSRWRHHFRAGLHSAPLRSAGTHVRENWPVPERVSTLAA